MPIKRMFYLIPIFMKKVIITVIAVIFAAVSANAQVNFALSLGTTLDNSGVGFSAGASIQSNIYGPLAAELAFSACSREASYGRYLSPRADLLIKAEVFKGMKAVVGYGFLYTEDRYTVEQEAVEVSSGVFFQESKMYRGQFWNPVVTGGLEYNFTKHFGFKLLANFSDQYADGNMKLVLGGTIAAVITL